MESLDTPPLLNLHECLTLAAQQSRRDDAMTPATVKLPADLKSAVDQICGLHGTTLSAWLRQCCHQLLQEYLPPVLDCRPYNSCQGHAEQPSADPDSG